MRGLLPDAKKLDRGAYYTVLIAFALVAVVLVTGALWAHYAWGRYWGWDPKEVGALVIWIVYAIYLHARVTYGWVGVPSAVIAVLGFFVILAGFLGVNLG
ncbi:MAG: cytochrome c biogenesis protein CcsA, partial [Myxococcota bacterium]